MVEESLVDSQVLEMRWVDGRVNRRAAAMTDIKGSENNCSFLQVLETKDERVPFIAQQLTREI